MQVRSRLIETAWQTNPNDCLLSRQVSRFVSLAVRVLEQNEAAGRYVPLVSVAGLIFRRSIEPNREHALPHGMPIYLSRAGRNACETDARRRIIRRHFEGRDTGMNLPEACRNFDFIEVRFAIRCGLNPKALHRSINPRVSVTHVSGMERTEVVRHGR